MTARLWYLNRYSPYCFNILRHIFLYIYGKLNCDTIYTDIYILKDSYYETSQLWIAKLIWPIKIVVLTVLFFESPVTITHIFTFCGSGWIVINSREKGFSNSSSVCSLYIVVIFTVNDNSRLYGSQLGNQIQKIVVPKMFRNTVLSQAHDTPLASATRKQESGYYSDPSVLACS